MTSLGDIRAGKPPFYPDQAVYAAFACAQSDLTFTDIDGGTGLIFTVGHGDRHAAFGAGRGSFYPQNNASATTSANDKYVAGVLMQRAGVPNLGGAYVFLHDRHRALRPPGHDRADAHRRLDELGGRAFVKPLAGSRGDFAQVVDGADALTAYMDDVARHHDAILLQRVVTGREFRVFVLDGAVVYSAEKTAPVVVGDGHAPLRHLIAASAAAYARHGVSSATLPAQDAALDHVLPDGAVHVVHGRMNRSAGGTMRFADPPDAIAVFAMARRAVAALGLRAGAVDLFTDVDGDAGVVRVIEVNANPSIRFLEDSGRGDLILQIWRHTFAVLGLRDV